MPADRVNGDFTVHAIVGPTGLGKSAAAIRLASRTAAPILVADRVQCFTDLLVTSGRAGDENAEGVNRIWLDDRTISDGEISPEQAVALLVQRLGALSERHPSVVMEGGSMSMLRRFAERMDDLPFSVSVQVMRIVDEKGYRSRLRRRARKMLAADHLGRSLLTELAAAWRTPGKRFYAASLPGPDCVLEWCAKYSSPPERVTDVHFSEKMLDELSSMICERYAEHGFKQDRIFSQAFRQHVGNPQD
jgi:adenylate dimethylallyltransferase